MERLPAKVRPKQSRHQELIHLVDFHLSGKAIPSINLRKGFGLPEQQYDSRTRIIVMDDGHAGVFTHAERLLIVMDSERLFTADEQAFIASC